MDFHVLILICLLGDAAAFIEFKNNAAYQFEFKSKFVLNPQSLGGQDVAATVLVKKFGRNGFVIRIKDSTFSGNNIHSKSRTDIEGIFGVVRRASDGRITNVITRPSTRAMEVLCKKMMVELLCDDLSFFDYYAKNYNRLKSVERHPVNFAVGPCDAEMTAVVDIEKNLTQILAQAEKSYCNIDPIMLKAGRMLLHGKSEEIGQVLDDSNFGVSVFFDSITEQIVKVSKFSFVNLVVGPFHVQARHNQVMRYVGELQENSELDFEKPYVDNTREDIDNFVQYYED